MLGRNYTSNPPNLDTLLSRLDNVRQYGRGWRAKCPAHDGKSSDSLSVAIGDDGRILLFAFCGCSAMDVLDAVGLEMKDLFPQRITHDTPPAERRKLRELARQAQWKAAIPTLHFESLVLLAAAGKLNSGEVLTTEDNERLVLAGERIEAAKGVFHGC